MDGSSESSKTNRFAKSLNSTKNIEFILFHFNAAKSCPLVVSAPPLQPLRMQQTFTPTPDGVDPP